MGPRLPCLSSAPAELVLASFGSSLHQSARFSSTPLCGEGSFHIHSRIKRKVSQWGRGASPSHSALGCLPTPVRLL